LTIHLPKAPSTEPRQIPITDANNEQRILASE